eukprot:TRINITY_DN5854_c0_g1_i1.p1 TRINITY_DN5854_c0_g1~~TRINITY_DN5854_c0_g1_i1.p1  ORF type:complete len:785 (+),score=135.56 TRINITY_DN5854_c0_g1_i1:90-2444(+)
MEDATLSDLHILAKEHGVLIMDSCSREEAAAMLIPVIQAAKVKEEAAKAVICGSLAILIQISKILSNNDPEGFYSALRLGPNATINEVKEAHRKMSLLLHEDRHSSSGPEQVNLAKELQQKVNAAKEVLIDPKLTAAYTKQGMAGVGRAELVPANAGVKEFLNTLDLIDKREKLLHMQQQLQSSGSVVVNFDFTETLLPVTDKIHSLLATVGYTPPEYDYEDEEEEEEEEEEEDEIEEEEDEDTSEGNEDQPTDGDNPKKSANTFSIAKVHINGKETYVLVPKGDLAKQVQAKVESTQAAKRNNDGGQPEGRVPPTKTTYQKIIMAIESLAMIPRSTGVLLTHSFSYPLSVGQVLKFSGGGSSSGTWSKLSWEYTKSTLQEWKSFVKWSSRQATVSFSTLRHLTSNLTWRMKCHLTSTGVAYGTQLANTFTRALGNGRSLSSKLTCGPSDHNNTLEWTYSSASSTNFNRLALTLGFLNFSAQVLNKITIPRRNPVLDAVDDEDEVEASKSLGSLTTVATKSFLSGTTSVQWKAMFHTSKKSTTTQVGFGVATSLPFAVSPFGLLESTERSSRTILQLIFQRNSFSVQIPIVISDVDDFPTIAILTASPILLFKLVQEIAIKPYNRMRQRRENVRRRLAQKVHLWDQHKRANDIAALLRSEAKKRLDDELQTSGLVIQNAKYGVLHPMFEDETPEEKNALPPRVIDVTIALQSMVQQHHLILQAGPKHTYNGFCDVDPNGEDKYLRVRYLFRDEPHEVEILEGLELALPLEHHRIEVRAESPGRP